jgi:hypothetical protein
VFDVLRYLFGYTLWFFIIGLALWRGGWPERTVAIINLVAIVLSPMVQERPFINHLQVNLLLVDLCVLVGFFAVAFRADRWWPLFAAAAALMEVVTRIAPVWVHGISHGLAITGAVIWSYVAILSLAAGVGEVEWRKRRLHKAATP